MAIAEAEKAYANAEVVNSQNAAIIFFKSYKILHLGLVVNIRNKLFN